MNKPLCDAPSGSLGACNENPDGQFEDDAFRSAFETLWHGRRRQLGTTISVVIRLNDQLHHCFDGNRKTHPVVGERYHAIKKVAHLPVRAFMLRSSGEHEAACPVLEESVSHTLDDGQMGIMESIMRQTRVFWSVTEDVLDWERVVEFADRIHPLVQELIREASRLEVYGLHSAMKSLEANVEPAALNSGYFCVVSGKEPRYKELSKQYFKRYLRDRAAARGGLQHQFVYAEGEHCIDSVFELLAKRHVNRQLAEVFTGSLTGLEQDILGEQASLAIEALFSDTSDGNAE